MSESKDDFLMKINMYRTENVSILDVLEEDPEFLLNAILFARDYKKGAGRRTLPYNMIKELISLDRELALRLLKLLPYAGRWDDLWKVFKGTSLQDEAIKFHAQVIREGHPLACKWAPREHNSSKKDYYKALRDELGFSSKEYRQHVVKHSNTFENNHRVHTINYSSAYTRGRDFQAYAIESAFNHCLQNGDLTKLPELPTSSDVKVFFSVFDNKRAFEDVNTNIFYKMKTWIHFFSNRLKGPLKGKYMMSDKDVDLFNPFDFNFSRQAIPSFSIDQDLEILLNYMIENEVPPEDCPDYMVFFIPTLEYKPYFDKTRVEELYESKGYRLPRIVIHDFSWGQKFRNTYCYYNPNYTRSISTSFLVGKLLHKNIHTYFRISSSNLDEPSFYSKLHQMETLGP